MGPQDRFNGLTLLAYLNYAPRLRFNGLTLLAYLNYTPRLRYTHEDQIHYGRTRSVLCGGY